VWNKAIDTHTSTGRRVSLWTAPKWWHLLSLDAPTVAGLWAWSFARAAHVSLPVYAPLLLALGTWLLYVGDRILDGLRAPASMVLRKRHHFYARHRAQFLVAALAVGAVVLWIIVTRMPPRARREDTLLFTASMAYFVLIHSPGKKLTGARVAARQRTADEAPRAGAIWASQSGQGVQGRERWLPKEMAVGVLFAAATAVPAWSRMPGGHGRLMPLMLLFSGLCWLNCVAIETWEHAMVAAPFATSGAAEGSSAAAVGDTTGAAESSAVRDGAAEGAALAAAVPHITTRFVGRHLKAASLVIAGAALAAAVVGVAKGFRSGDAAWLAVCVASCASALLFVALDAHRSRLGPLHLRIAADAVLLTPLVLLVVR
jgi:hypothetical protein